MKKHFYYFCSTILASQILYVGNEVSAQVLSSQVTPSNVPAEGSSAPTGSAQTGANITTQNTNAQTTSVSTSGVTPAYPPVAAASPTAPAQAVTNPASAISPSPTPPPSDDSNSSVANSAYVNATPVAATVPSANQTAVAQPPVNQSAPSVGIVTVKSEAAKNSEKFWKEAITKAIEDSKFGVLHADEIFTDLREIYGEDPINNNYDEISHLLGHFIYASKGYYTTPKILEILKAVNVSLKISREKKSTIFQGMLSEWNKAKAAKSNFSGIIVQDAIAANKPFYPLASDVVERMSHFFDAAGQAQNQSYYVIEGVPGSGKTSNVIEQLIEVYMAYKNTSSHDGRIYLSAPNAGGFHALIADLSHRKGKLGDPNETFVDLERLINTLQLKPNDLVIIDEVYTADLELFSKLMNKLASSGCSVVFSGDSLQNLPNRLSIVGVLDRPKIMLTNSRRACDVKLAEFPKTYVTQGIHKGLEIFSNYITVGNEESMEHLLITDAVKAYEASSTDINMRPISSKSKVMILTSENKIDEMNDNFHHSLVRGGSITNPVSFKASYQSNRLLDEKFKAAHDKIHRTIQVGIGTRLVAKEGGKDANGSSFNKNELFVVTAVAPDQIVTKTMNGQQNFTFKPGSPLELDYAKMSLDSQGESITSVWVLLDKGFTIPELYVALTRNKGVCENGATIDPGIKIYASETDFPNGSQEIINRRWYSINSDARDRTSKVSAVALLTVGNMPEDTPLLFAEWTNPLQFIIGANGQGTPVRPSLSYLSEHRHAMSLLGLQTQDIPDVHKINGKGYALITTPEELHSVQISLKEVTSSIIRYQKNLHN